MATKSSPITWTEEEKVRGLNVLFGDGEPAFDEAVFLAAWRDALAHEGEKVSIGETGKTLMVRDGGHEIFCS